MNGPFSTQKQKTIMSRIHFNTGTPMNVPATPADTGDAAAKTVMSILPTKMPATNMPGTPADTRDASALARLSPLCHCMLPCCPAAPALPCLHLCLLSPLPTPLPIRVPPCTRPLESVVPLQFAPSAPVVYLTFCQYYY